VRPPPGPAWPPEREKELPPRGARGEDGRLSCCGVPSGASPAPDEEVAGDDPPPEACVLTIVVSATFAAMLWRFSVALLTATSGLGGDWCPTGSEPGTNATGGVPRTAVEGVGPTGTAPAAPFRERVAGCAPAAGAFAGAFTEGLSPAGGAGTACGTGKCPGFRVAPGSPGIRRSGARPSGVAPESYRSNVVGVGSCQSAESTRPTPFGNSSASGAALTGNASAGSICASGVSARRISAGEASAAIPANSSTDPLRGLPSVPATAACGCCGDCCARASPPKKAKTPAVRTNATIQASDLRLRGSPWLMVSIAPPRNKSLSLPIVLVATRSLVPYEESSPHKFARRSCGGYVG
jgi:hypothetical protein